MNAKPILVLLTLLTCSCAPQASGPPIAPVTTLPMTPHPPATRPSERTLVLGQSIEGRPITLNIFGEGPRVLLILGAIHGNEPSSATVAQRLTEHLRQHPEAAAGRCVAILPVANPDGLARTLRTNKRLVDLNRNFPAANWAKTRRGVYFGGPEAATEPETLALIKLFEQMHPVGVVSIHSMDKPCNNYDGPARPMAELMSRSNGYAVKDNIGYATPGSLGSWAGIDRNIPIVTLELPRSQNGERAWEQNRDALLAVIRAPVK